jgi:hypothetical protein
MPKTFTTPAAFYQILHRIADGRIGRTERQFLMAIQTTVDEIDAERLMRALANRDISGAFDAINLNGQLSPAIRAQYAATLAEVFRRSAVAAEAQFPSSVNLRFDLGNRRAIEYARTQAAQLVTNVEESARANIRRIVSRAFRFGDTVQEMARQIRDVVGLTIPQGDILHGVRLGLEVRFRLNQGDTLSAIAAELNISEDRARILAARSYRVVGRTTKLSAELIQDRIDKYAGRLLRQRARVIARTETIASSAAGQQALWQQAADKGLIDPDTTRQFWIVTPDERTCAVCLAIPGLNADGVPLGGQFQTPVGPVTRPPEPHPNCRCALGIRTEVISQSEAA